MTRTTPTNLHSPQLTAKVCRRRSKSARKSAFPGKAQPNLSPRMTKQFPKFFLKILRKSVMKISIKFLPWCSRGGRRGVSATVASASSRRMQASRRSHALGLIKSAAKTSVSFLPRRIPSVGRRSSRALPQRRHRAGPRWPIPTHPRTHLALSFGGN